MSTREDIQAEVTARIVRALEDGTVPWRKPWSGAGFGPTSVATGRPYRGINVWLLELTSLEAGYASPLWLTFKQARAHGGSVRKGEHGTRVVFWKPLKVADKDAPAGEERTKTIPLMRTYTVFNLEQCDGVELPARLAAMVASDREPVDVPQALADVLQGYANGPALEHRAQDRAFYTPSTDTVTVPLLEAFEDPEGYAETLLHELTHSTGHASRLDRFERNGEPQHFGSQRYAREELVAEMGAAMLAASQGIPIREDNTAAYIASWLEALEDDHSLVIVAAQQAQRACDRILGTEVVRAEESDVVAA